MAKYVWPFRVQLLLYIIIVAATNTAKNKPHSSFNIISDFLKKFIKPYLRSTNIQIKPRTQEDGINKDTEIENLIIEKIVDLKHLLDDNVEKLVTEDKLTLRGDNETTVIEFLPKTFRKTSDKLEIMKTILKPDPLKSTINKYKKLREKIEIMLVKEKVSEDTKTLIIKTLDDMVAHLIESQCIWTLNDQQKTQNDTKDSLAKVRNMTKKQWKNLREQYIEYLTKRVDKENAFINQFHRFFSDVLNDTNNLGDRYKIRCQLVQIDKDEIHNDKGKQDTVGNKNKAILREKMYASNPIQNISNPSKEEILSNPKQCETFILCSSELREFFIHFYNNLNDTAVNTFKNYASMYIKDVNTDLGVEKNVVVSIINNIGVTTEEKVKGIYKKELKKFSLDTNKIKSTNIEYIMNFINKVVNKIKKATKKKLANRIKKLQNILFLTVKEDLMVNIEIDLDNLERNYKDIFCSMFVTCNGRYATRRLGDPWTFRPRTNNEVFVKVQLSLDDEMKNAAVKSGLVKMLLQPHHKKYRIHKKIENVHYQTARKSFFVTRTTLKSIPKVTTIKANISKSLSANMTLLNDVKFIKDNEILKV